MTGPLGRVEQFLERVVEGGMRALFRNRLQPIELAKAAARAMQSEQIVGPDGLEVPNAFTIRLHPADFGQVAPFRVSLEARIARYLTEFADVRGLVPVAPVEVEVVADERVHRRGVRVEARMSDVAEGPVTRPAAPLEPTAPLPALRRAATSPAGPLTVVLEDGRRVPLSAPVVSIGRALDNDLVIADSRVSRYHAQIVRERGAAFVRDLGSTNGTLLDGRRIAEERLEDGDQVSLGGYLLRVELAPTVPPTVPPGAEPGS